jgi:hypothetical protein
MDHRKTYEDNIADYWAQYKEKIENTYGRFFQYLPKKDATLITLKGHLLIEESLNELLQRLLKLPSAIEDARLSFFQKVCIAQAIVDDVKGIPGFWSSIKRLNSIRNRYAHKVNPENIQDEIFTFIKEVLKAVGMDNLEIDKRLKKVGIEKMLSESISALFVGVRAAIDGIDAAKLYPKDIF